MPMIPLQSQPIQFSPQAAPQLPASTGLGLGAPPINFLSTGMPIIQTLAPIQSTLTAPNIQPPALSATTQTLPAFTIASLTAAKIENSKKKRKKTREKNLKRREKKIFSIENEIFFISFHLNLFHSFIHSILYFLFPFIHSKFLNNFILDLFILI